MPLNRPHALLAALLLIGCGSRTLKGDGGAPDARRDGSRESLPAVRDVDIVFVVDNSSGGYRIQPRVIFGFPAFARALASLPGGLPNLHLAVISSDMGAGPYDVQDIPHCRPGGDQGAFQYQPRNETCAKASLDAGEHFISNVDGKANYSGSVEDVFGCIAELGHDGCSFEHPFASLLRALGADGLGPPSAENVGFLRPNAALVVVFVTDEDDCSAPRDSTLFNPSSRHLDDPLGPLTSYRCNEFGHLCGGKAPPRTMGANLGDTCRSAEDGRLVNVSDVVARLAALKAGDERRIVVSALAGPPSPYVVELGSPALADDPSLWPESAKSCVTADGSGYALPAVRINELVAAFGENGVFQSFCGEPSAALQRIAEQVGRVLGPLD